MAHPHRNRTLLTLAALAGLLLAACGGGGGAGADVTVLGPVVPVPFDGPTYQAFPSFGGLSDAAVDIYQDIHDLDARFLDVKKRLTELNPVS